MKSIQYTVKNPLGIHARPAALLAQACTDLKSAVTLECNGNEASGKNVLQILALHAAKGSVLNITVEGPDEEAGLEKIKTVLAEIAPKDKKVSVLKVAFFGTKDYDRIFFSELSRDKGEGTYNVDIKYFSTRLTVETAHLADGFDAVCIFVNDEAPREAVKALADGGVRLIDGARLEPSQRAALLRRRLRLRGGLPRPERGLRDRHQRRTSGRGTAVLPALRCVQAGPGRVLQGGFPHLPGKVRGGL